MTLYGKGNYGSYEAAAEKLEALRLATLLTGEYDKNNAIISVHGGSGGTDAKDWAEMLFRMYQRYCDRRGWKVTVNDACRGRPSASTAPRSR